MKIKSYFVLFNQMAFIALIVCLTGCSSHEIKEINIGYIGPLTTRATDLGIAPSQAMELVIEQYNKQRAPNEPKVNFFIEDDQWDKKNAIPAYNKLRKEHNIDVLFISNTDGTIAVQDKILAENVILVNPLNNDHLLASLNKNTFNIAKSTEDAMGLVALRIIQLNLQKVIILQYPNDFMKRGAMEVKRILDEVGIENKILEVGVGQEDFSDDISLMQTEAYDAYVFFGYKEFGFAMKQIREVGITAQFFGATTMMDPELYDNSEGTLINTEFPFFTAKDGNYILAENFLNDYENKYNEKLFSVWPAMQAYDAMRLTLNEIKKVNKDKKETEAFGDWLIESILKMEHYQGVCGNLRINEDGTSRGIYFSLYESTGKGEVSLINE
ncbi:ABC transporter substrate-binding protein [Crocinitomix catalasitica]|uniref:ABC transporter substrate-binding protein n=1 Tax=Crocinitomix catalasitica TaxID=184607 RepID=UPI000A00569B|nr:ABC transporter substrate-binding protein [Crocinitomix catalasitica]